MAFPLPLQQPAPDRRPGQDRQPRCQCRTALDSGLKAYPNLQIQTRAQFEKSQLAHVNRLLGLVYALLALAVLIALISIVNTLMLSVFERMREIGLLRAVGMKRRQVRAVIRSESVIIAVFGAVIGVIHRARTGHRPGGDEAGEFSGHDRPRDVADVGFHVALMHATWVSGDARAG